MEALIVVELCTEQSKYPNYNPSWYLVQTFPFNSHLPRYKSLSLSLSIPPIYYYYYYYSTNHSSTSTPTDLPNPLTTSHPTATLHLPPKSVTSPPPPTFTNSLKLASVAMLI